MNTFGLKRSGFSTLWLGYIKPNAVNAWQNVVRFTLTIRRIAGITLNR